MKTFQILIILYFILSGFVFPDKPFNKEVIELGDRREIFIDHYLIDKLEGTRIKKHAPEDRGPVLFFERPWESNAPAYITIIKDENLFRAYYRGGHSLPDGKRTQNTCYAESKDGINWVKPSLGLIEVNGSKENNILLDVEPETHNFSPFIDENPKARPSERYKAFGGDAKKGLIPYASPDGIHWKRLKDEGVIKEGWFDSQNVAFWSESEQVYVCYFRTWTGEKTRGYRTVSRSVSKDFLNWSDPAEMSYGDTPYEHIYTQQTSSYYRAPHIYVAIGSRFIPHRQIATDIELNELKVHPGQHKGLSESFFMTSRGGNVYDRTFMDAFIRPGIGINHWTARTNYPALNVVQTGPGEMSVYVNQDYAQPTGHLRRYSMRIDGFTSLNGPYKGGVVITKPFTFLGKELEVNYSTAAGGEILIEIQDENGNPIPGFTLAEAQKLIGNEIDGKVNWNGDKNLTELASKPVRLYIYMKDADLYSIRFK
jgi:hypothetical protein